MPNQVDLTNADYIYEMNQRLAARYPVESLTVLTRNSVLGDLMIFASCNTFVDEA
jgi:hypothetical protein